MITLTEKRLRELESRIPQYEAKIADLESKSDAHIALPKEIADVKALLNDFITKTTAGATVVSDSVEKHGRDDNAMAKTIALHTEQLRTHQDAIECSNVNINGHTSKIDSVKDQLGQYRTGLQDTRDRILSLSASFDECRQNMKQLNLAINTVQSKANSSQGDSTAALSKLEEHDRAFEKHEVILKTMSTNQLQTLNGLSSLEARFDRLQNPAAPKSYDAEIAEIRKDIAAILVVVHSTASQAIPPPAKVDDKIKAMETAIAQIYGLLKKYER